MDIDHFISLLPKSEANLTSKDRADLSESLRFLIANRKRIDPSGFQSLLNIISSEGIKEPGFKAAACLTFIYHITGDLQFLSAAVEQLQAMELSLIEAVDVHYTIETMVFVTPEDKQESVGAILTRSLRRDCLKRSKQALVQILSERNIPIKDRFEDNNRVVILSRQFLSKSHAPTNFALQYAKDFISAGKEVIIISSCEQSQQQTGPFISTVKQNVNVDLSKTNKLSDDTDLLDFYQPPNPLDLEDCLVKTVQKIEDFDPAIICVIGNNCVVSEVMQDRAYVFMVPLANDLVLTEGNHYLITALDPAPSWDLAANEGLAGKLMFNKQKAMPPLPQSHTYTRAEYDIEEEAFVAAIVGNRLPAELTDGFLDCLDQMSAIPNLTYLFLGPIANRDQLFAGHEKTVSAATFIDYDKDLLAIYDLCDCFINPPRKGGGSSAYYATRKGLPVIGLNSGDCRSFVVDPTAFNSLEDYQPFLEKMTREAGFYTDCQTKSKSITDAFLSYDKFITHILDSYQAYCNQRVK